MSTAPAPAPPGVDPARALALAREVLATEAKAIDALSARLGASFVEALRRGFGPVTVWTGPGSGPGNNALAERGATRLTNAADVLDFTPTSPTPPSGKQLTLG